jgi:hypothetical protein
MNLFHDGGESGPGKEGGSNSVAGDGVESVRAVKRQYSVPGLQTSPKFVNELFSPTRGQSPLKIAKLQAESA